MCSIINVLTSQLNKLSQISFNISIDAPISWTISRKNRTANTGQKFSCYTGLFRRPDVHMPTDYYASSSLTTSSILLKSYKKPRHFSEKALFFQRPQETMF